MDVFRGERARPSHHDPVAVILRMSRRHCFILPV
jgi:hypothetical protein